ncbi:hypothetical protein [Membranihabitans maritimus]|uniref:hypothetical protein n=1 Tax=Membranihabitans maritimus TaxID=2904244 RepID=UPI001F35816C|nr:hypothetical protein [Membranihabitans maritimus]
MKKLEAVIGFIFVFLVGSASAQVISKTFEMRQFTNDPSANGETDFKGETEWMDTEGRVKFLNHYADFSSRYFKDQNLDRKVVKEEAIDSLLNSIKPQPLPDIRKEWDLEKWKSFGYREGQEKESRQSHGFWSGFPGVELENGVLILSDALIEKEFEPMDWRFKLATKLKANPESNIVFSMCDGKEEVVVLKINGNGVVSDDQGNESKLPESLEGWIDLTVEGDIVEGRFNLLIHGEKVFDFIPFVNDNPEKINRITFQVEGKVSINDILLMNYRKKDNERIPYVPEVILDEEFRLKYNPIGWNSLDFDDSNWDEVRLPAVHGGILEEGEALYLRKELDLDEFERGTLEIESLTPGGEIWINGDAVAVIDARHPNVLDVTPYLRKNTKNIIAVKVRPYRSNNPMTHSPADRNIGWFLDETKLVLSSQCMIKGVDAYTKELGEVALQSNKIRIEYPRSQYFEGSITVNYYPWFPEEGGVVSSMTRRVSIKPRVLNTIAIDLPIEKPELWHPGHPYLYKVEVILKDKDGNAIDDKVITTGIRTVSQRGGHLYINQKVEMLNGVQIMGFRTPVEDLAKYNRCPPDETVAEEMLMVRKMDANLLRIHVHSEKDTADGINDVRYARMADQMGVFLIWSTAGFIREGEAWNVDFEGYPQYMSRVINHPSIVMWEASNHPNRFKDHDISDSHEYISRIYNTIYSRDASRLISPTSFWQHTHYGNYQGDTTYTGLPMNPVPEYHAPLMTRGSQDAYTGYGAEWTKLRKAPNEWAASCLVAGEKAYFNFEHEESAGQPNWELSKGKPWYKVQSYEWSYEEGSIGRKLQASEWRASQAWQAFSAWESMKKQMLLGYDGFSWCSLRGGANSGTYQKPLIDNLGYPKLAFYTNKMVFQRTWAGSDNVDVVYGPTDEIRPVIHHLGNSEKVNLHVKLVDENNTTIEQKEFKNIDLKEGRDVVKMAPFRFKNMKNGFGYIIYEIF